MKKTAIAVIMVLLSAVSVQAQISINPGDYLTGTVANISKSHTTEALTSLSAYKANVLGCMMVHAGNESSCSSMDFQPTTDFNYQFSQPPQDGSAAWAIQASGNGRGAYGAEDTLTLSSDASGNMVCQGAGQLTGVC